jgi:hypothetical protein
LYSSDRFQKPNPFSPDVAVDISDVFKQKIYAMAAHESQYFEWLPWTSGLGEVPEGEQERLDWLAKVRYGSISEEEKKSLRNGMETDATNVESFEICEYGRRPSDEEIRQLFPMLGKK